MDPISIAALLGAGASILSGLFGSNAADKASKAEEKTANRALDIQQAAIAQARLDAAPWLDAGKKALVQYQGELGLGGTGAGGQPFVSQFKATPGYDYAVNEAEKGVTNNLAALGMRNSGAALKALTGVREGIANQEYGNYLARLSGLAGVGQNAMTSNNAAALGSAGTQGQLIQDAGAARASGYVGAANAWSGALNNFSQNIGSWLGNKAALGKA